jgi:hypothetical protein
MITVRTANLKVRGAPEQVGALRQRGIVPRIARPGFESRERVVVVERALSWLKRSRGLTVRYERRADIPEAFLSLGCALICRGLLKVLAVAGGR